MTIVKAKMEKMGFRSSSSRDVMPRLIMSICGLEKQGKTHFSLTAPGPIALFSVDIGDEGVVHKFQDKEVFVMDIEQAAEAHSLDDSAATREFEQFKKGYYEMLQDRYVKTIVVDTATEMWEILRLARFGRISQVMPYQYGPVNREFRILIKDAFKHDKNVILLHKMKPVYVNDKRTADYEQAGFSETGSLTQLNAMVYRYSPEDGGEFAMYIKDSRHNPDLAGEELVGPLCNFDVLMSLVVHDQQ